MTRVMLVNDFYAPHMVGGAEMLVRELAAGLQNRGHSVAVVTARVGDLPAYENIDGIDVHRIGRFPEYKRTARIASGSAPGRLQRATIREFQEVTAQFRPDVTHFHNVWLLGPFVVNLAVGRKGMTIHDYWPICLRRTLIRVNNSICPGPEPLPCRACRLRAPATLQSFDLLNIEKQYADYANILASCDFVTAPSRFMADQISRVNGCTPSVIYNGIDKNAPGVPQCEATAARPYALFASRSVREKGYDIALQAFNCPELSEYELLVAADAIPSGLPNVQVLGAQSRDRVAELIAASACVIVPSVWKENCPMIIIEALRAGVPIIASRVGGIPELIEDGVTGLLTSPGNAQELASKIRSCFENPQLRASARVHGPAAVLARFSRDVMMDNLEVLYAA